MRQTTHLQSRSIWRNNRYLNIHAEPHLDSMNGFLKLVKSLVSVSNSLTKLIGWENDLVVVLQLLSVSGRRSKRTG